MITVGIYIRVNYYHVIGFPKNKERFSKEEKWKNKVEEEENDTRTKSEYN